jgi:methionine biosynthesis protein MetW
MNDNRNYIYIESSVSKRKEYVTILKWIKKGTNVIDLGSGDGTLLKILKVQKKTMGVGIEISASGVEAAKKKGIKTIVGRIDEKLPFKNKEFDYAICNVTVQMVMYPEILIKEMVRISKKQIITFPNFAFFMNRLEFLMKGKMPKFMIPGYDWFSTGHVHQLSIKDFETFCENNNIGISKTAHIGPRGFLVNIFPNLFALIGVFMTEQKI